GDSRVVTHSHRPWAASRRDSPASLSPDSRVGRETLHLVTGRTDYWDHKVHPCPAVRDSQVGTDSHRPWAACRRDSPASLSPDSRVARGSLRLGLRGRADSHDQALRDMDCPAFLLVEASRVGRDSPY